MTFATFKANGFLTRGLAWRAYSEWIEKKLADAETTRSVKVSVRVYREDDRTWAYEAELACR